MTARSILLLLLTAAFSVACESNRVIEPVRRGPDQRPLDPSVFTTLEILPDTVTLEEGATVQLEIVARDQRGAVMPNLTGVTFSSSDPAIASVSSSGLVKGVTAGLADISATKTLTLVTRSAAMRATIRPVTPSASLVITADLSRGWQPSVAHLAAGGTVQWVTAGPRSWSGVPHGMLYLLDKNYEAVDSLDLRTGSATLTIMTAGEYRYCSAACWDPPDYGVVYVHSDF